MLENLSVQKRIIIAVLIAFVFFVAYDHFYLSKLRAQADANQTINNQKSQSQLATQNSNGLSKTVANANNLVSKNISQIKSSNFHATIDEQGRISSFLLDGDIYKNESGESLNLVDSNNTPLPLEMRFVDSTLNQKLLQTPYVASSSDIDVSTGARNLTLTQTLDDIKIEKILTFYPDGKYTLDVKMNKDLEYFISPGFRPNVAVDSLTIHGAIIRKNDGSLKIISDGSVKNNENFPRATIAAGTDRYYTTLFYNFDKGFDVVMSEDTKENAEIFILNKGNFSVNGYIGTKNQEHLKSIDPRLLDVVEYGWFTFLAKPMFTFLSFLHGYVSNWGWAIILFTIIIRIVLFPLTYKGMVSMNKIKDLAPKMKEIQERYKDDKQKMQMHIMELYKKHGANPMGGCLPMLLQIPIFFAIYRVLLNAIELKGAPWILWIKDLEAYDPYFILPIFMGAMMYLQQRLAPTNFTDPMQEKIMRFLPLIFTFFLATFPAGLTLYWCVNNAFSVVQQLFVNKLFAKAKENKTEITKK